MRRNPASRYFLLAFAIVLVDQFVKVLVKTNMLLGEQIPVFGSWFKIQFIENPGAAFGLKVTSFFGSMSEETGKIILTIFSFIALAGIVYFLVKLAAHRSPLPWFLAMVLGGAIGNIVDRTFYGLWFQEVNEYSGGLFFGRVVDMFYFDLFDLPLPGFLGGGSYHLWPIFNIADSAITVGILALILFQDRFNRIHERHTDATEAAPATTPGATEQSS